MNKSFLVLGDTHMPWMDKGRFSQIIEIIESSPVEIDYVVQIGDLYDMFSQGRWARSPDLITPKEEMTQGRAMADEFWRILRKRCPKASCYQLMGNHDERPMKRVLEKAPELSSLLDIKHLWEFEGVNTVHDGREEVSLEGIYFMHGFRSKLGDHARFNQAKTVVGHSHRGGVQYFPVRGEIVWELNAGYLGAPEEVPLQYTKQKLTAWTQGFGWIDELGPRFCPF